MSSKTIDERVVQMQFDNSRFEKNVQQSMGTIDKLKKSLNFKDSVKDLDELDKSALGVSKGFNEVGDSLDGVANKLINLKNVFKFEVFSRIAGKVVDVAEKTIKSLSIDPILSGWSKYEEKVTSVQTIMSATASTWEANAKAIGFAGTQMEFVNAQLDKLNWFSDETSFSFTDMTSNIGKFTSAGVDLDKAVTAMEGISVWAAKSGQNAQSASRAYYNLAQAMSVGSVKLMDWKSIENANMATMEFKKTAIETAEKLKYLKKVEEGVWKTVDGSTVTVTNFNEALKDEWFSAEVLMDTLKEYGKAATKLSEINEEYGVSTTVFLSAIDDYSSGNKTIEKISDKLGISVKELIPLFETLTSEEYKLSMSAFRAAQEAKTFKEVIDATKDAVSTGWMNTWELIFGNYEEAKKLWSDMAEGFYNIFAEGGNNRNRILENVFTSSWDKIIDKINKAGIATESYEKTLIKVMEDAGIPIHELLEEYGSLEKVFQNNGFLIKYVKEAIAKYIDPIKKAGEGVSATTEKLEEFQGVVNGIIRGNFGSGATRVQKLTEAGYNYATMQGLVNKVWEKGGHTWKDTTITMEDLVEVMGKLSDEELENMGITRADIQAAQDLLDTSKESGIELEKLLGDLTNKTNTELFSESLLNFIEAISVALDAVRAAFAEVFSDETIAGGIRSFLEGLHRLSNWLIMSEEQAEKFKKGIKGILNIVAIFIDIFKAIIRVFFPGFAKGANLVNDGIFNIMAAFGDWTDKLRGFFSETNFFVGLMQTIKDAIVSVIDKIKEWLKAFREIPAVNGFIEKVYSKVKDVIDFIRKLLATFKDDVTNGGKTFAEAVSHAFSTVRENVSNFIKTNPVLKKISDILGGIANKFKDIGKNIDGGFFEGMRETATKIYEGIKNFVTKCLDKIKEMLGIHSPSKWFIDLIWNCARGIAQGIIEVTRFIVDKVTGLVTKVIDTILGITRNEGVRESFIDTIKQTWKDAGGVRAKLVEIFDKVVEYLRKVKDWIAEAIHNIIDYFKSLNKDELKDLLLYILEVAETIAKIKALWDVGTGFKKIGQAFEDIGDGISGFFKGIKSKNTGKALLMLSISVAIITGCIIALSKLSGPEVDAALEAVGVILVIMGAILIVLSIISVINTAVGKMKLGKGEKAGLAGNGIAGFELLILSLAASLAIVLHSVDKYNELAAADADGKLNNTLMMMVGFIVGMMVIVEAFTLFNAKAGAEGGAFKAIGLILALCLGLVLVIKIIEKTFFKKDEAGNLVYDADKVTDMAEAFIIIGEMLIVIGGVLALIAAANGDGKGLKGAFLAVVALVVGLIVIIKMITELTVFIRSLDADELTAFWEAIGVVAGALILIAGLLAVLARCLDNDNSTKGMLATSLFLAILLAFMAGIVVALKFLEGGNIWRDLVSAGIIFVGVFGALGVIIAIVKQISDIAGKTKPAEQRVELIKKLLGMIMVFMVIIGAFAGEIAYIIHKLSKGDILRDLVSALVIIGPIILLLVVLKKILDELFEFADKYTKPKIENVMRLMVVMGAFMVVIGAFAVAVGYLVYELQGITWSSFIQNALLIFGSIIIVVGAIYFLLKQLEKMSASKIKDMTSIMWSMVALILVIAAAITAMALILKDNAMSAFLSAGAIAVVIAGILAIIWIFNKLNKESNTIWSAVMLLAVAAAVAIVAYSLYQLAKVDSDVIWNVVLALLAVVAGVEALIGILAYFASSGVGGAAILIAEGMIVAFAFMALAIGYVIDKLTDLMIVLGVMAYGEEFAKSVAIAFSTRPMNDFGEGVLGVATTVDTAAGSMTTAFGSIGEAVTALGGTTFAPFLQKIEDFTNSDEVSKLMSIIDIINKISGVGSDPMRGVPTDPEEFKEWIKTEKGKKWAKTHGMDIDNDDGYDWYGFDTWEEWWKFTKENTTKASKQAEKERADRERQIEEEVKQNEENRKKLKQYVEENPFDVSPGSMIDRDTLKKTMWSHTNGNPSVKEDDSYKKGFYNYIGLGDLSAEAGKQSAIDFSKSFISSFSDISGGNYLEGITNLKNMFGSSGFNLGSFTSGKMNISDFTDINMIGEYMGIDDITSTDFLQGNSAIADIQNNQGGIMSTLNSLISSNNMNNNKLTELSGYWQTIAENSGGTVEALNGMGVYMDSNLVGQITAPVVDQILGNKYVGMLRGQTR